MNDLGMTPIRFIGDILGFFLYFSYDGIFRACCDRFAGSSVTCCPDHCCLWYYTGISASGFGMTQSLGADLWTCFDGWLFSSLVSDSSLDFWRVRWLCVACFHGLISCFHVECLLVFEAGIPGWVGGRNIGVFVIYWVWGQGGNGDLSRFSATELMMTLGDWISGAVGDVCVYLQLICWPWRKCSEREFRKGWFVRSSGGMGRGRECCNWHSVADLLTKLGAWVWKNRESGDDL